MNGEEIDQAKVVDEPLWIYVAGPLNDQAPGYIQNLREMIDRSLEVARRGHYPYCPGIDILLGLVAGNWDYTDYFDNSGAWLYLLNFAPNNRGALWYKKSPGADRERNFALQNGLIVFNKLEDIPWTRVAYVAAKRDGTDAKEG